MGKCICFVNTLARAYDFFLKDQMACLAGQGYHITFACGDDPGFATSFPEAYSYRSLPMRRGIDLIGIAPGIYRFYKLFRQERYDLVQYSGPNAALYASIAAYLARVPVRIYAQWGIRYVGFSGPMRWLLKRIEKVVCAFSTVIEPDSLSNQRFAIDEGLYPLHKSRVVWNGSACGVDLAAFDPRQKPAWRRQTRQRHGIPDGTLVLGFVGALRRDKGTNELFAASQRLSERFPEMRLLLVGDKDVYHTVDRGLRDWADSNARSRSSAAPRRRSGDGWRPWISSCSRATARDSAW